LRITAADRAALLDRDQEFFTALVAADMSRLEDIVATDFLIVDIGSGSVFTRDELLDAVRSGAVRFPAVEAFPDEASVRRVESVGIVVGRTAMNFQNADGTSFVAGSRYTHVYALQDGAWRLLSAQGTTITEAGH
jgi:hypothetical protein